MENKKTFGDYVKTKRAEAGLTQKEFADKLYVTESAVSKWERGLSYPDITLVTEICAILNISERELLTANEDVQTRNHERLAKRYLSLIRRFKTAQYIIYGLPVLTCFIVNLAVNHTLSWFWIVLSSIAVSASLTLLPMLFEKKRGLITLGGFTGTLVILLTVCAVFTGGDWLVITLIPVIFGLSLIFLPFFLGNINLPDPFGNHKALIYHILNTALLFVLLLTASIYTNGGWFFTTAVPLAAFWLILPWGYMGIIRYTRINRFFKASGCFALTSVLFYFTRSFTDMILGEPYRFGLFFDFNNWHTQETINGNIDAITFFSVLGLTLIFAAAGVIRETYRTKSKV
ncbi:MAG: helix-turn-helix domain-containing protein [Oscillospiraceae bacterium]|nr:helix-turn-helix domain-containing protein [Oscillospiraceae bacterium]